MAAGFRLKEILRSKGMTIKQLSEKSGVSLNTLYSITKRDSERIDPVIEVAIANALNIPVSALHDNEIQSFSSGAEFMEHWNKITEKKRDNPGGMYVTTKHSNGSWENDYIPTPQEKINEALQKLNEKGKTVAAERVEELTQIPAYKK